MLMYTIVSELGHIAAVFGVLFLFVFKIQNNLAAVCVGRQIWVNNERLWGMMAPIW